MNAVQLTGRLTREAAVTQITNGSDITNAARFTLAVDGYKNTAFISCVAYGRLADWVEKWTGKGTKIELTGRISTGSYTNTKGIKVYYTEVVAIGLEFGETKAQAEEHRQREQTRDEQAPAGAEADFMDVSDIDTDGLPFV